MLALFLESKRAEKVLPRTIQQLGSRIGIFLNFSNNKEFPVNASTKEVLSFRDHLHVLFGKFTNDGQYLRNLQKKGSIHIVKQAFNLAVKAELGICHKDYTAQSKFNKTAKKRAPQWKVKAAREHEAQEQKLILIRRNFEKILTQCDKWLKAFELDDTVQMNRQYKRISKSLGLLDQVDVRSDKFVRLIDSMTTVIDEKSQKKRLPKLNKSD